MRSNRIDCVIDPFFIVSWSRYRFGHLLSKVVERCYVLEEFYNLFTMENTIRFLRSMLESKRFVVYDFTGEEYEDIYSGILKTSIEDDRVCQLDRLIARLLAISIIENIPFLSDNYCVHRFARIYLDRGQVWSSYDLIRFMVDMGVLGDLNEALKAFSEDTGTMFIEIKNQQFQNKQA